MSMVDWLIAPRLQRLLAALMLHPGRDYRFNELIAIAAVGRRGGQMAITDMVDAGIISDRRQGNQRLFRANPDHPLYPELRSICVKTFGISDKVRLLMERFPDIETAFLFGSVAKGSDHADSDVDVIAIGTVADPIAWSDEIYALETALGRALHISLYGPEEWEKLVATDPVIQSILSGPKIMVTTNGKTTAAT